MKFISLITLRTILDKSDLHIIHKYWISICSSFSVSYSKRRDLMSVISFRSYLTLAFSFKATKWSIH